MKKRVVNSFVIVTFLFLIACEEEEVDKEPYAQAETFAVSKITSKGATFNGELIEGTESIIIDHGFVWGLTSNLSLFSSSHIRLGSPDKAGKYSIEITSTLEAQKTYYVRSFVISRKGDREQLVYAAEVSFVSQGSAGPAILDFSPKNFDIGEIVNIQGGLFNPISNITVFFGGAPAQIIEATDTYIRVIVPESLETGTGKIVVYVSAQMAISDDSYELNAPKIHYFSPTNGIPGNWFQITGQNFVPNSTQVFFNSSNLSISYQSSTYIQGYIPYDVPAGLSQIKVKVFDKTTTAEEYFENMSISLTDFSPKEAGFGDVITLTGTGFSPETYNNYVYFSSSYYSAEVISATSTKLEVKVPEDLYHYQSNINIWINGYSATNAETFKLKGPQISAISPATGAAGSQVEILGENFSPAWNNEVTFGGVYATILQTEKNKLVVEVPFDAPEVSEIQVTTCGQSTSAPVSFVRQ